MRRSRAGLALSLLLGLVFDANASLAAGVAVTGIRFAQDAGRIRIVLDSAVAVPFTWDLAADGRHLTVTLVGIDWRPPSQGATPNAGSLSGYRFVPAFGGAGQVDIDAAVPLQVLSVRELPAGPGIPAHRIVIDLAAGASGAAPDAALIALKQGLRAVLGLDGAADFALAVRAFTKAAAAGNAQAAFNLGEMYRCGLGLPQDYQRAAEWFERAARADFAPARFHLAVLAFNGLGMARDRKRARELLELAAEQGLPQARQALTELK